MKHIARIILFVFLACLPSYASDLQQQQSTLYPYRSMIEIQDDFMFGIGTSGNIGYGWGFANGSVAWIPSEAGGRIGLLRRDTTAVRGATLPEQTLTLAPIIYRPGLQSQHDTCGAGEQRRCGYTSKTWSVRQHFQIRLQVGYSSKSCSLIQTGFASPEIAVCRLALMAGSG